MAKVLMIGPFADTLRNFRHNLLGEMVRRGHQVFACAPDVALEVQEQLARMHVSYKNFPLERAGMNLFHDLASLRALVRIIGQISPDVVFLYNIKPVVYGSIAASLTGVPLVGSMINGLGHTFSCDTLKRKIVNQLVRRLYKFALNKNAKVFFQNPDDLKLFQELGLIENQRKPVLVNGSGVDLAYFSPQSLPDEMSFILISRLIKEKGITEYLEAARIIKDKYPQVRFRLAGWIDDQHRSVSREEIERYQRLQIVEYLGKLSDVRPAIAEASVYVLPSYYREGIPRTLLESMAMGRALITTDSPGCREAVRDGDNGFMIPVQDVPALAQAMESFILHPELVTRMGAASRKMAEAQFDEAQVNKLILDNLSL